MVRGCPCYADRAMGRRIDERRTLSLFPEEDEPTSAELQSAILAGVSELSEDNRRRPLQCFTIKMPLPLYLEFKKDVQHLRSFSDPGTSNISR